MLILTAAVASAHESLAQKVRAATSQYVNVNVPLHNGEGWVVGTPCVSGPDFGAMGQTKNFYCSVKLVSKEFSPVNWVFDRDRPRTSQIGGPARTRTEDQGIHFAPPFPEGVDYLFTPVGCGTL